MAIIELTDINVKFKNETILENVNLSLEKNKIYGFIGANGSGKSVLFKTMCGYIRPTSGNVTYPNFLPLFTCLSYHPFGKDFNFYNFRIQEGTALP